MSFFLEYTSWRYKKFYLRGSSNENRTTHCVRKPLCQFGWVPSVKPFFIHHYHHYMIHWRKQIEWWFFPSEIIISLYVLSTMKSNWIKKIIQIVFHWFCRLSLLFLKLGERSNAPRLRTVISKKYHEFSFLKLRSFCAGVFTVPPYCWYVHWAFWVCSRHAITCAFNELN